MREIHFILDEAATVLRGGIPAVEEALVLGRSFGIRKHFFFQSRAQLKEAFRGKESVLLDNCDTIYFGVKTYETAESISKQIGSTTITVEDANENRTWNRNTGQPSDSSSRSSGRNWKEMGRELLKPEEILAAHPDLMLAFIREVRRPIICWKVKWYEDPRFGGGRQHRFMLPVWWILMVCALGAILWALWK